MQPCPRQVQEATLQVQIDHVSKWAEDDHCNYCGALNNDTFMARLEAGDILLSGTDKNYKVYVKNNDGKQFLQSFRNCPQGSNCKGPDDCAHWVTRETDHTKFYFQHLTVEQRQRFVELYNERKIKYEKHGELYFWPFFMTPIEPSPLHPRTKSG